MLCALSCQICIAHGDRALAVTWKGGAERDGTAESINLSHRSTSDLTSTADYHPTCDCPSIQPHLHLTDWRHPSDMLLRHYSVLPLTGCLQFAAVSIVMLTHTPSPHCVPHPDLRLHPGERDNVRPADAPSHLRGEGRRRSQGKGAHRRPGVEGSIVRLPSY